MIRMLWIIRIFTGENKKKIKKYVFSYLLFMFFSKLFLISLPFFFKSIVDNLHNIDKQSVMTVTLASLAIGYGLCHFFSAIFEDLRTVYFVHITNALKVNAHELLFTLMHNPSYNYFEYASYDKLSQEMEIGIDGISNFMKCFVFNIVPTIIEVMIIGVIFSVKFGVVISLIFLISISTYFFVTIHLSTKKKLIQRHINLLDYKRQLFRNNSFMNNRTVKYFTNEQYEIDSYNKKLFEWFLADNKNKRRTIVLSFFQSAIITISIILTIIFLINKVLAGNMDIGDLVLANIFLIRIYVPINNLGTIFQDLKDAIVDLELLDDLLNVNEKCLINYEACREELNINNIEIENISLKYGDRFILKDLSLKLENNNVIGIVGRSGSGKSTLAYILLRIKEINSGSVLINGIDYRKFDLKKLRKKISVVPQDIMLINDTIYNNIKYGNIDATDEQILEVMEISTVIDFAKNLKYGWNTIVGDGNHNLSGGERQRIAIARALLKNSDVYIFDEATSALDVVTERNVMSNVKRVLKNKLLLLIAHRLSSIADSNLILVFDKNKIVEKGEHHSLITKKGLYHKMWLSQQINIKV
ncbi:ATP-binding cassette domain-containing protein [Xenorhabdus khoisanae]|uniref:ATP-binding cassette domain-containing protein n=1 Tax=Xenorhabdus khoisanae TaxID=880157 RepID=UPI00235932E2|nr:ATP-binding cassette domain-containing protein [Xenorhabdus khoisanae]MDC9615915.1 ATP-binding cassette domain-containing protein [Xenorhabdus khoisanae]